MILRQPKNLRRGYDTIPPWAWFLGGGFMAAIGATAYLSSHYVTVKDHADLAQAFSSHLQDNVKLAEKIADKDDSVKVRLEAIQSQLASVQTELAWTKATLTRLESQGHPAPARR